MAGVSAMVLATSINVMAQQNRQGPPDMQQMRQRRMERLKEQMGVTSADEWKIIEERLTKVSDARREIGFGGMFRRGGMRGGGQGGQGGQGGGGGDQGGDRRPRMGGGEPDPDVEALQKAIDSKASNDEIKAKLAKYRESRKAKQAKLAAAQEELRKVLSVRQEAVATLNGYLD